MSAYQFGVFESFWYHHSWGSSVYKNPSRWIDYARLHIHHDPEEDKAVTKDELMNEGINIVHLVLPLNHISIH